MTFVWNCDKLTFERVIYIVVQLVAGDTIRAQCFLANRKSMKRHHHKYICSLVRKSLSIRKAKTRFFLIVLQLNENRYGDAAQMYYMLPMDNQMMFERHCLFLLLMRHDSLQLLLLFIQHLLQTLLLLHF